MTNLRDFQLLLLLAMIMLSPVFFSVPVAARGGPLHLFKSSSAAAVNALKRHRSPLDHS